MKNGNYEGRITKESTGRVYGMIVYIDGNEERVIHGFKSRHFANEKNAIRAINKHLSQI